jgi:hypothetical protein
MSPHSSTERRPESGAQAPSWWHRDHPTFTALTGFFTGLAFVIVVPGVAAGLLHVLADADTAEGLFPVVLVALLVPLVLIAVPRTRRFGLYVAIGMVVTALVVLGVAALVLWLMVSLEA